MITRLQDCKISGLVVIAAFIITTNLLAPPKSSPKGRTLNTPILRSGVSFSAGRSQYSDQAFFSPPLGEMEGALFAQTPDELIKSANKFYQDENYQSAIELYQKILSQGLESGALYFNLGNAYFKTSKLGYAIFYYEKGLKLEPNDEDLLYNLKIANSRTVDKITELPKLLIVSWWEGLITSLSISGWSFVVVFVFWILLSSIAAYFFSRRMNIQKISFVSGSIALALLIFVAVLLFARVNRDAATNYGILLESSYSAKVSPDSRSSDAFVIHEGIKFSIEDRVNDWSKIRLVDGKVGWIQKNVFGQI